MEIVSERFVGYIDISAVGYSGGVYFWRCWFLCGKSWILTPPHIHSVSNACQPEGGQPLFLTHRYRYRYRWGGVLQKLKPQKHFTQTLLATQACSAWHCFPKKCHITVHYVMKVQSVFTLSSNAHRGVAMVRSLHSWLSSATMLSAATFMQRE